MRYVILDSTPLGLLTQRSELPAGEECRQWFARLASRGVEFIVPAIIDYEFRRELLRAGKASSIRRLDALLSRPSARFLPLTTPALRLAANLWATSRQQGQPTADVHALDIDVILAAQTLTAGLPAGDFVVATSNVSHLSLFVPAAQWPDIE